jgi:hypothetical protein
MQIKRQGATMDNNVEFVAKGLMLDNLIDDMLKEIELTGADIELLYKDYKFYKPCIVYCDKLYTFIMTKFYTKESIMRNWREYISQVDFGIYGFIDYCVVDFTRGTKMRDIDELETLYINKKIKQRIQKLNRSIQ